jgi:hypothetical protein
VDAKSELIKLYSTRSTADIENTGDLLLQHFGVATRDSLLALPDYQQAFTLISRCAARVDNLAAANPAPKDQAREGIRVLRQMINDNENQSDIDSTKALIEGRLYPSWPADAQSFYDVKKEILEWRDFFVSYTNRDAPATNRQFRPLIKSCFGREPKGDEINSNFLARVITRHLRRYQNLSGFFDEDNLKVGEIIQEAVNQYCRRSFALVQLIEPLTLEKEPPRNWCYYEYSEFSNNPELAGLMAGGTRHFFLVTSADVNEIRPASLATPYRPWVDRITNVKYIGLKNERNSTLRPKIKTVAEQILVIRAAIIEAWLKG